MERGHHLRNLDRSAQNRHNDDPLPETEFAVGQLDTRNNRDFGDAMI